MTTTTIDSRDAAPIGSVWQTEAGNRWRVIEHIGEFVRLERIGRKGDYFVWHISTLTQTTATRVE